MQNVLNLVFSSLTNPIKAKKTTVKLEDGKHNACFDEGSIIGVDEDVYPVTKDTFIQFQPKGIDDLWVLRIAAFANYESIINDINAQFDLYEASTASLEDVEARKAIAGSYNRARHSLLDNLSKSYIERHSRMH